MKYLKVLFIVAFFLAAGIFAVTAAEEIDDRQLIVSDLSTVALDSEPSLLPAYISATTGRFYFGEEYYNPVAVMIDNSPDAIPQWGLQMADIVYEGNMEGGYTRFMAIYNDYVPDFVGNIRSCRIYFIRMQQEWDAILLHCGGPGTHWGNELNIFGPNAAHIPADRRFNGLINNANRWFVWREYSSDSRLPSPNRWYNVAANPLAVQQRVESVGNKRTPLLWSETPAYADSDYETISSIQFRFFQGSRREYRYSAETGLLTRYNSGTAHIAGETGKPLQIQNLVIMHVEYGRVEGDNIHRICKQTGSGVCEFIIGGKYIKGTWSRPTFEDDTLYLDDKGNEIVFTQGNTWIELAPASVAYRTVIKFAK